VEETLSRTRCRTCGRALSFDEWTSNGGHCDACAPVIGGYGPAATYVRGPARQAPRRELADESAAYERLLDELPDELVDELVAALEAEAERLAQEQAQPTLVRGVIEELGLGRSPREGQWAAWGFAGGFAANVMLAKYAQMESSAAMSQFIAPMLIGGVIAGLACAAIGWGAAKLKDR
jgi:hypothetical protein